MRKKSFVIALTVVVMMVIATILAVGGFRGAQLVYADLESAPKVNLKDVDGNSFQLSDYKGKVVIVNFWAVWCPPCKLEIPSLIDLYRKYAEKGLMVVGIALDSGKDDDIRNKAKEFGITYPVINGDHNVRRDFGGIRAVPTTLVINQEGKIYKTYLGYREKAVIEEDVQALIGPPEPPAEKSET